ncbi:POTRA domain-containing protein [Tenacibaculum sp. UWU-22]|uniref:POTRA domain-containing protein n=1 Tax=Tenacibaculum sp. UWU-22 TaxID=3234187 RepID=UPI0034DAD708
MARFNTLCAYLVFFIVLSNNAFAQKLTLTITSKDSLDAIFLKKINFKKTHWSEKSIYSELDSVSENLKHYGYFLNVVDSVKKKDSVYYSYFTLNKKVEKVILSIPFNQEKIIDYPVKNGIIELDIANLSNFLKTTSNKLENQGKSFSEVKLKNIRLKQNVLFADLNIKPSKKRTIDRIIVKGYSKFSKSYLYHFLNIKKGVTFNKEKLIEISKSIESLPFVSEIKSPEILFSKDSTILYLYIKKKRASSFDGLINFASKENSKGLLFNGYINLQLNNSIDTGEQFELFWKANGEERQQFKVLTDIPYIFNTSFSPNFSFTIYKQDSTFLNTKFHSAIGYNVNAKTTISLTYDAESSNSTLKNNTNNLIQDFDNSFLGIQFKYQYAANDTFLNNRLYVKINPSFGSRTDNSVKNNQFKIDFEASYLWLLNQRNAIYVRNETGYLNSDSYLTNELYRIGGVNSIRGFNEQAIVTPQFSYLNFEYRYLTSQNSYVYSITDVGNIKTINAENKTIYGLGFGYLFYLKKSQISLGYALGKVSDSDFNLNQSKLLIKIISFF